MYETISYSLINLLIVKTDYKNENKLEIENPTNIEMNLTMLNL